MHDKYTGFKTHILDINDENGKDRLQKYYDSVFEEVKKLGCRDITIETRIKQMNDREFKLQSVIQKRSDEDFE